jgi:hypothetical protein
MLLCFHGITLLFCTVLLATLYQCVPNLDLWVRMSVVTEHPCGCKVDEVLIARGGERSGFIEF